ncbi:MAG: hypothetical protein R2875_02405 [Desulfobacterales bacterium]
MPQTIVSTFSLANVAALGVILAVVVGLNQIVMGPKRKTSGPNQHPYLAVDSAHAECHVLSSVSPGRLDRLCVLF